MVRDRRIVVQKASQQSCRLRPCTESDSQSGLNDSTRWGVHGSYNTGLNHQFAQLRGIAEDSASCAFGGAIRMMAWRNRHPHGGESSDVD